MLYSPYKHLRHANKFDVSETELRGDHAPSEDDLQEPGSKEAKLHSRLAKDKSTTA